MAGFDHENEVERFRTRYGSLKNNATSVIASIERVAAELQSLYNDCQQAQTGGNTLVTQDHLDGLQANFDQFKTAVQNKINAMPADLS